MKKLLYVLGMIVVMGTTSCQKDSPADTPRTSVPEELLGAWEHGYIDFEFWEHY